MGGDEPEGGVRLEVIPDRPADDGMDPDVVGERDRVEPGGLGGFDHLAQQRAQVRRASLPGHLRDMQAKLHGEPRPAPRCQATPGRCMIKTVTTMTL